jgi:hypothetical protein
VRAYLQRSRGLGGLRLPALVSCKGKGRGSSRGPRASTISASIMADDGVEIDLLGTASHPDGYSVRLAKLGVATRGRVERANGRAARYHSPKLFIGRDRVEFELVDDLGVRARGTVEIDVRPNPRIGMPFDDDETYFDDETGWALDPV